MDALINDRKWNAWGNENSQFDSWEKLLKKQALPG
jgi:hypothetical protein